MASLEPSVPTRSPDGPDGDPSPASGVGQTAAVPGGVGADVVAGDDDLVPAPTMLTLAAAPVPPEMTLRSAVSLTPSPSVPIDCWWPPPAIRTPLSAVADGGGAGGVGADVVALDDVAVVPLSVIVDAVAGRCR